MLSFIALVALVVIAWNIKLIAERIETKIDRVIEQLDRVER